MPAHHLTRALLAAAVAATATGFWLLATGSITLTPLLLTLAYGALWPIGLYRSVRYGLRAD